jgi:hypothetical protein
VHGVEGSGFIEAKFGLSKTVGRCSAEHSGEAAADHEAHARGGTERLCRSRPSGAARICRNMERERGSRRAGMRHSGPSRRAYSVSSVLTTVLAMPKLSVEALAVAHVAAPDRVADAHVRGPFAERAPRDDGLEARREPDDERRHQEGLPRSARTGAMPAGPS